MPIVNTCPRHVACCLKRDHDGNCLQHPELWHRALSAAERRVAELEHERDAAKEGELQALLALTRTKAERDAWRARARRLAAALAPFAERSCVYYESGPGECRSFCAERDETLCDTCEARAALDAAKGQP